jgi:beta-galactosidase
LYHDKGITKPADGFQYVYRVNCGGPEYKDVYGNVWKADKPLYKTNANEQTGFVYSSSWSAKFDNMPPLFASQRRIHDPVDGTRDWELFQNFRYGKDQLRFVFPLPDGDYLLELFFAEPWLGVGGSKDEIAMRLFDVAVNDRIVLKQVDIWREAGTQTALKRSVIVHVTGGSMTVSFPNSKAGQALISAIAISSKKKNIFPAPASSILSSLSCEDCQLQSWLDEGDTCYSESRTSFRSLPANLFTADWLRFGKKTIQKISFVPVVNVDVFVAVDSNVQLKGFENTHTTIETDIGGGRKFDVFRKRIHGGAVFNLQEINSPLFVMLLPATDMQPAYDLKPVVAYRQADERSGEVSTETVNGRSSEHVTGKNEVSITYEVETGVADIYSVTLKYFYPGEKDLKADIAILDAAGKLMKQEEVSLVNTKPGKWNTVTINTGTMINAGSYKIILSTKDAMGLAVSGVDIQ